MTKQPTDGLAGVDSRDAYANGKVYVCIVCCLCPGGCSQFERLRKTHLASAQFAQAAENILEKFLGEWRSSQNRAATNNVFAGFCGNRLIS